MLEQLLVDTKRASLILADSSVHQRNQVLRDMATILLQHEDLIMKANQRDLDDAADRNLSPSLMKRLSLSHSSIQSLAAGLERVIAVPDPLSAGTRKIRPNGLILEEIRVPLGVIALIYESRPGVTIEAASLAIKSGNAILLRGGSEAQHTNQLLHSLWVDALDRTHLPKELVVHLVDPDRQLVESLMHLRGLDLLIPRGGPALIERVTKNATVPVIATGVGNCHLYIDKDADIEMGLRIFQDSKLGNPAVCNAIETLLVHQSQIAFVKEAYRRLQPFALQWHSDESLQEVLPEAVLADERDWQNEYLGPAIATRLVVDVDEALSHIAQYGTGHSEAIVTENYHTARYFLRRVDAAAVYWNASTRFTDGGEFGLSAEVGISTQKLHIRGPMGLEALTTTKTLGIGAGHTRDFFRGSAHSSTHES